MNSIDTLKTGSRIGFCVGAIAIACVYFQNQITLWTMHFLLANIMLLCVLFPYVAIIIDSTVGRIKECREQHKAKKRFQQFMSQRANMCCFDTDTDKLKKIKTLSFSGDSSAKTPNLDLGPQLQDYLLNYGRIAMPNAQFCGLNRDAPQELDMLFQSQILHQSRPRTIYDLIIEDKGNGKYILVDNCDDSVRIYDANIDQYVPTTQNALCLYDYIQMRLEGNAIEVKA